MSNDSGTGEEPVHGLIVTHVRAINAAAFEARQAIQQDMTPEDIMHLRAVIERCFISSNTLSDAHRDDNLESIVCRAELLAAAANSICVSAQRAAELAARVLQATKEAAASLEDPESY